MILRAAGLLKAAFKAIFNGVALAINSCRRPSLRRRETLLPIEDSSLHEEEKPAVQYDVAERTLEFPSKIDVSEWLAKRAITKFIWAFFINALACDTMDIMGYLWEMDESTVFTVLKMLTTWVTPALLTTDIFSDMIQMILNIKAVPVEIEEDEDEFMDNLPDNPSHHKRTYQYILKTSEKNSVLSQLNDELLELFQIALASHAICGGLASLDILEQKTMAFVAAASSSLFGLRAFFAHSGSHNHQFEPYHLGRGVITHRIFEALTLALVTWGCDYTFARDLVFLWTQEDERLVMNLNPYLFAGAGIFGLIGLTASIIESLNITEAGDAVKNISTKVNRVFSALLSFVISSSEIAGGCVFAKGVIENNPDVPVSRSFDITSAIVGGLAGCLYAYAEVLQHESAIEKAQRAYTAHMPDLLSLRQRLSALFLGISPEPHMTEIEDIPGVEMKEREGHDDAPISLSDFPIAKTLAEKESHGPDSLLRLYARR